MIQTRNPYNLELIAEIEQTSAQELHSLINSAVSGFKNSTLLAIDRFKILSKAAELLELEKEEFAVLVCQETGKPIRESRFEVDRACTTLAWSAQEALRIDGLIQSCDVTEKPSLKKAYIHRVPLGLIAAITPFNFPLNIPSHKIGPALASGNAVIIKPSPKSPLSTSRLVELFFRAGLPRDLLKIVHGGPETGKMLVCEKINAVSFTGSATAGRQIAKSAAGKKLTMELGGNDPVVVMDDADLESAALAIVKHRFSFSGQRCTSCKRVFIHKSVYEDLKNRLNILISQLRVGDPMNESTDIGPLIDDEAADNIQQKIESAKRAGAVVISGGTREGRILHPVLIENLDPDDPLVQQETFGPVLPIAEFENFQEAIELVNSTPYGLQSAIFTNRMDIVKKAFQEFEVGTLIVNEGTGFRVESLPFGGVKDSGIGREGIRYAINEFTTLKTLIV